MWDSLCFTVTPNLFILFIKEILYVESYVPNNKGAIQVQFIVLFVISHLGLSSH